jgi:hypothetical protein
MDPEVIARIEASRERMRRLVEGMSDADLARPLNDGSGWTIAATLAHIALWDRRALVLLRRWEREGIGPAAEDFDAINDALVPQWLALPPRAAADLALAAAEEVDPVVATLTAAQLEAIAAAGGPIRPDRSAHRAAHLDAIERALASR